MQEMESPVKATEPCGAFGTAKAVPQEPSDFESVLLAIAGHDLRQPLQVIQSAHEFLGLGIRAPSIG
jgi:two-component system phosphate regulon sensor histidine kinase PhoR